MGCGQSDCGPSEAAEIQDVIVWRKIQKIHYGREHVTGMIVESSGKTVMTCGKRF